MLQKIKNNNFIGIALMLLYFYIGEIQHVIFRNDLIVIMALGFAAILLFSKVNFKCITGYEAGWILAYFVFIIFRNSRLAIGEFDINILYYGYLIIIMIILRNKIEWIPSLIRFLYFIAIVHACATIVFKLYPPLFNFYASNFVSPIYYSEVVARYNAGQITGLCVNYGVNAGIIALGTGISALYFIFDDRKKMRSMFLTLFLLFGLLLTGKRSPAIFTVASIFIVYMISAKKRLSKKVFNLLFIITFLLVVSPLVTAVIPQLSVFFDRLLDKQDWMTLGGRTELYDEALRLFKNHKLFGNGWMSYFVETENTIGRVYEAQYSRMMAHNIYLQLLAETGIIGLSTFLYLFLCKVITISKRILNISIDSLCGQEYSKYIACLLYLLIFFLLYGFSGNPLYDAYMYFIAFLCMAGLQSVIIYSNKRMSKYDEKIKS